MERNCHVLQRAFKHANKEDWLSGLVNWFKQWKYWHEEVVFPICPGKEWSGMVVTSDTSHGVYCRPAVYSHPKLWDFVTVPGYEIEKIDKCWKRFKSIENKSYGWLNIITTHILGMVGVRSILEYDCDEASEYVLGIPCVGNGANTNYKKAVEYYESNKDKIIAVS
jgi:hypothetical protein